MSIFSDWNERKQHLDQLRHQPPFVSEGDIWWSSFGQNIGCEMNGKSNRFTRPVIIFRKLARNFYLVVPTTTKEKFGSWYAPFSHGEKLMRACLQQIRIIDYRRLIDRIGRIDEIDMQIVRSEFWRLYG